MYPMRPPLLVPTFVGAWVGSDERLPAQQHPFLIRAPATRQELMVRLLRDHAAFEANLFEENNAFLVARRRFLISMRWWESAIPARHPKAARAPNIPSWPAMPSK